MIANDNRIRMVLSSGRWDHFFTSGTFTFKVTGLDSQTMPSIFTAIMKVAVGR
jgi:hypothetical protein